MAIITRSRLSDPLKSEPKNVQFLSDQILRTFYCSCLEGHAGGKLWD